MSFADSRTLTELLELLSHPRRRFVLHALRDSGERIDTTWLAEAIAAWETSDVAVGSTALTVDGVSVSLYHTHFPKLVEAGLLVYDGNRDCVEAGERTVTELLLDDELRLEREDVLAKAR